jgi:hypothetical protein
VSSEPGKGTVFTLTLPIDPVLDADAETPASCRLTAHRRPGAALQYRATRNGVSRTE